MKKTGFYVGLVLLAQACAQSSEDNTPAPLIFANSWQGECVTATQGSQRAVIAFSGGRFSVRTFFFRASSSCSGQWASRTDRTLGTYSERGSTSSGLETRINITITRIDDPRETSRHEAIMPRSYDLYYIENDSIYYGDYGSGFDGSSESRRPVTYNALARADFSDIATVDVF